MAHGSQVCPQGEALGLLAHSWGGTVSGSLQQSCPVPTYPIQFRSFLYGAESGNEALENTPRVHNIGQDKLIQEQISSMSAEAESW